MNRWKKMLGTLLTVCIISILSTVSVLAADKESYTYTVTLSAGNMGTINGQDKLTLSELSSDKRVSFDLTQVQVADSKYYVKGVRLSGHDNADALDVPAFNVTGDADYVVAYGIKGDMVSYTVNFQDGDGRELAPSGTFYGNVGDKPVVAYQYIENYVPQALAITKTLSANEAENIFTFVYAPGEAGTVIETTTTETTVVDNTVAAGAATPGAAGAGDAGAGAGAGEAGEAGTDTPGNVENPDEETPRDLVDLDDEETPKSNMKVDAEESNSKPLVAGIAIIAVSVLALVALIIALKKRAG